MSNEIEIKALTRWIKSNEEFIEMHETSIKTLKAQIVLYKNDLVCLVTEEVERDD